jgi:glutathione S-transferase/elongation factor 1-gamma
MKIYGFATFNVLKVLGTAEELGLDYEYIALDPGSGEHKTPEHIERHPMGKVPVIEDDGRYLYESNTICRYLAARENASLYGGSSMDKAIIDQQIDMISQNVGHWYGIYFVEEVVKKNYFDEPPSEDNLEEAAEVLSGILPMLDNQLKEKPFMTGDQITIADIIGFSYFSVTEISSANIDAYIYLKKWYDTMAARAGITRAMAKLYAD